MGATEALTIPSLLDATASLYPDTEAVVDGTRRYTYSDLAALVRRASGALVGAGVSAGDTVAIWAPNSAEWIVTQLALARVGAVLVPLNTRFQGPEAEYILRKSRASVLYTVGEFLGRSYPEMLRRGEVPDLARIVLFDRFDEHLLEWSTPETVADADLRAGAVEPSDWLDLMFTSGTTGHPKGVRSRHGDSIRSFRYYATNLGIRPGDRYLLVNPLFHTFGAKAGVVAALTAGATVHPVAVFDAGEATALIAREGITVLPGPPTIYHSLLQQPPDVRASLRSLRLAVTGAAAVPVELLRRMDEELGFDVVLTAYGLTETIGLVTMCRIGDPPEVVSRTSGRPIPGLEVRTVRADGSACDAGEAGEVVVRGYAVMDGYFEDPEATAEAIDAGGWLHTGDVGVLDDDGGLRITDRIKDMFIVGGFNAYPAEIEAALMELPAVAQVAVVGVPDDRLGEVGAAFVVPRPGATVDAGELLAFARSRLANYKVPRSVAVVDSLPVNAGGKVMKHLLRQQAAGALSERNANK
ncbi:MAG TPA: FadD3 family acyl-CoA ligase [Acidimicrobiales bacterium]|nr:FadD3 family acyl-CoA ligase [Acidimicrobiales bacterium]